MDQGPRGARRAALDAAGLELYVDFQFTGPPGVVSVAVLDGWAAETALEPGWFRFTRTGGDLATPLTVTYTVGGTATPGADYQALAGTVTFAAGQRARTVGVWVIGDRTIEASETFLVTRGAAHPLETA